MKLRRCFCAAFAIIIMMSVCAIIKAHWDRVNDIDRSSHGRLRIHRRFGRVVRVEIDTLRQGYFDRDLHWSFWRGFQNADGIDSYPDYEIRDVNFDRLSDTWIHRESPERFSWSVDTGGDARADLMCQIDIDSLKEFDAKIRKMRGFGIFPSSDKESGVDLRIKNRSIDSGLVTNR